jgi:hypothetical protein
MPYARGPILAYLGSGRYRTVGPTEYVGEREVIHIPSDFETDLASVPRIFWALLPPTGVYEAAAVAREGDAGLLTRWALWVGVRWGALANPHRRPGIGPDLPLMLLITAAGAAVVVGVFAAVHLLVDWAGRLI